MLILLRHSKTSFNLQGIMQGSRMDPNIVEGTELKTYVDTLSPQLKNIAINSVICSPMRRAISSLKQLLM